MTTEQLEQYRRVVREELQPLAARLDRIETMLNMLIVPTVSRSAREDMLKPREVRIAEARAETKRRKALGGK